MLWYEDDVLGLEAKKAVLTTKPELIFYGSSSIRLWDSLEKDFDGYLPLNLGFGGSTLSACVWFFERIFAGLQPSSIIIYAGDNDLGDGKSPDEVFHSFQQLMSLIQLHYGDIPVGFISVKPSISRWDIVERIRKTNQLISAAITESANNSFFINIYDLMTDKTGYPKKEFLGPDGLHINATGYALWKEAIFNAPGFAKFHLFNQTVYQ